ncbi:hypothetical protein [Pantoea anthophila]
MHGLYHKSADAPFRGLRLRAASKIVAALMAPWAWLGHAEVDLREEQT